MLRKFGSHLRDQWIGTLALFLVLSGGTAYAVTQIDRNSVKSKHIVNGEVKSSDLSPTDAHVVGTTGEPAFRDGGAGDCSWGSFDSVSFPRVPVGFFREPTGVVHLQGVARANHGPGGDGQCDGDATAAEDDSFIFQLPAGYRPPATVTIPAVTNDSLEENGLLITGTAEAGPGGDIGTYPPGSVVYVGNAKPQSVLLDGISFKAAD